MIRGALPALFTHGTGPGGIIDNFNHGRGKVRNKLVRIKRGPSSVADLLQGNQQTGLTMGNDLRNTSGSTGNNSCTTGHGLQVHDSQGLVNGRAGKDSCMAENLNQARHGAACAR